ncbi:hypothetical protein CP8484711_0549, partial [Chlamydia psittaci 84-8471/1]
MKDERVGK